MEKMIPKDVEVIKNTNLIRDEFGGGDFILISIELDKESTAKKRIEDIRDPRVIKYVNEIVNRVKKEPEVSNVQSIIDFLPKIPNSLEESKYIIKKSPFASKWVNDDNSLTLIRVQTYVASDEKQLNDFVDRIKKDVEISSKPPGVKSELTGIIMVRKKLFELIKEDGIRITVVGYILIFLVLSLTLASIKRGMLPLISVSFAIIWTAGTLKLLNVPVSVMTVGVAPMLLGLGIDYGIHMTHRLREEAGDRDKISKALSTTGKSILATSSTTIAGFGSLIFAKMPGLRDFGTVGVVGMFYAMIASLLFLPCVLLLKEDFFIGKEEKKSIKIENFFRKMFVFQINKRYFFIFMCFIMILVFSQGFKHITMESSSEKSLPQDLDVIKSMYKVRDNFGGAETVIVLFKLDRDVHRDIREKDTIEFISKAQNLFRKEEYVSEVFGVPEELMFRFGKIPDERELKSIDSPLISDDSTMCISFLHVDVGTDARKIKRLMENLQRDAEMLSGEGIEIKFAGSPAVTWVTGKLMMADFQKVTFIALLSVSLILYITFRRVKRCLLVTSPLFIAITLTFATLGFLRVPLRPETIGLASTILGIGIDYSILMMHRYLEEKNLILGLTKASPSIFSSSATTVVGFSALYSAKMIGLKNMGLSMTIGIAFCALVVFLFFPAILAFGEKQT